MFFITIFEYPETTNILVFFENRFYSLNLVVYMFYVSFLKKKRKKEPNLFSVFFYSPSFSTQNIVFKNDNQIGPKNLFIYFDN